MRQLSSAFLVLLLAVSLWLVGNGSIQPAYAYKTNTHQTLAKESLKLLKKYAKELERQEDHALVSDVEEALAFWENDWATALTTLETVDTRFYTYKPATHPLNHGWNLTTKRGWSKAKGAVWLTDQYTAKAVKAFKAHNKKESVKSLSVGLHMVQDLTVPHHEACKFPDGHNEYETACEELSGQVPLPATGIYLLPGFTEAYTIYDAKPSEWVKYAATFSKPHYASVGAKTPAARQHDKEVARQLMAKAIQLGAGYLYYSYWYMVEQI